MKVNRDLVIQKNNELCQEFYFCHSLSKLKLNQIYNFSYTGGQLWDLFCPEAVQLENTYNISIRRMLGLPQSTHRYLIQPLANGQHLKQVLIKRFLQFCEKLRVCSKEVVRETFEKIKKDVRTTTGKNLAELGILLKKPISELSPADANLVEYAPVEDANSFKIDFIKELIEVKHGELNVDGFEKSELEMIMEFLCTS